MASKTNGLESSDWARVPPPSGSIWERIGKAIYDPEDKSFLGRTPKRWGIAITFYLVFYAVLALLFAICMAGLFYNLDEKKPYFTLGDSLIEIFKLLTLSVVVSVFTLFYCVASRKTVNGTAARYFAAGMNPGVDYRPRPADGVSVTYDVTNSTVLDAYTQELRDFLKPYQNEKWFLTKTECGAEDNFGFPNSPCFYIKLNKIYGWKPEYYDAANLPADMASETSEFISNLSELERQQVWVSCWEENSNATKLEYPWGRGLASRFFPYLNENGYLSPLVAVKVTPPVNTEVVLRCRAWAKNIIYNKSIKEATGYARIHLKIEDHTKSS